MRYLRAVVSILVTGIACFTPTEPSGTDKAPTVTPRQVLHDDDGLTVAVMAGETLFLSGVTPADTNAPIARQTQSAMERLGAVLAMQGLDFSHVVSCHVNLSDMDSYAAMNSVYGGYFAEGRYPARTTVEMAGLPDGAGVLLLCIAYADAAGISIIRPPSDRIPPAMGPYSSAVRAGHTVYLSGQGGRHPTTGLIPETSIGQVEQTLHTIGVILASAGLGYDNVVLANSYLPPSTEASGIDAGFEAIFKIGGAPSHSKVPLTRLPGDIAVEITFVAVEDDYVTRLFMHEQEPTAVSSPVSLSGGVAFASAMTGDGDSFRAQLSSAVDTQEMSLGLASMGLPNVVRIVAYLSDLSDIGELHVVLEERFPDGLPALAAVQVRHAGESQVALEMIAVQ